MAQIIYLMNTMKNSIPQIMILMHLKMLEIFLMDIEVIFYVKKQMKLEKNFIKKKMSTIF